MRGLGWPAPHADSRSASRVVLGWGALCRSPQFPSAVHRQVEGEMAALAQGPTPSCCPTCASPDASSPSRGPGALDAPALQGTPASAPCSSLCGIDHEALNKQIMEYKRRKGQGRRTVSPEESLLTAHLATQTREGKVAAAPCADGDLSPRNHPLGAASNNPSSNLGGAQVVDSSPEQEAARGAGRKGGGN